ncbi:MAG TPA: serine hydrolase domain-containing protein [Verrucomicrobiae bacterium]|nr:serine hydrolase domain-containing protein [Verrucomicrobiae bacterium]
MRTITAVRSKWISAITLPPSQKEKKPLAHPPSLKLRRTGARGSVLLLAIALFGLAAPRLSAQVFRADKLAAMDQAIETAISSNKCPGGVLWLERNGTVYEKAYGNRSLVPDVEPMTEDTIFDMASLTKVMATTPAIMLLIQRGQVQLDAPVSTYIPEFTGGGKEHVTVRELLTHTSGLPPDIETSTDWHGWKTGIKMACAIQLDAPPGTRFKYSDINFILLGEIVRRVSHTPLNKFVQKEIYGPLKMTDTGYLPPKSKLSRIAPTEVVNGKPWHGVVHDPTARHMGGVAGHAGLFSTAHDLARYARMMLNMGELDGVRLFTPETVKLMTSQQMPPGVDMLHGLGWDIDTPYSGPRGRLFPIGSYGHTGWTGTSVWIDPYSKTFVIFLSNRNHPTEAGNVIGLRRQLGTLAAEAVIGFDWTNVPGALKPD